MKSKTIIVIAAFAASICLAQGPRGRGAGGNPPDPATMVQHRIEMLTNWLRLNADQQTRATTIFTDAATASQTARTQLQDAHTQLKTAIKNNDAGSIDAASMTIGTVTGQLTAIQAKADALFYVILTADQKAKFDKMGGRGMGMGMGPMGGPGGFGARRGGGRE